MIKVQLELEVLQRDNTTLLEQSAETAGNVGSGGLSESAASPEMSGIQEEVEALNDMQANTVQQLNEITDQHAVLLEQMT